MDQVEDDLWYESDKEIEMGKEGSKATPEIDNLWAKEEVSHLTRSGRHFKPHELEEDYPGRELDKGKGKTNEEEEEDRVLKQMKKTQANITVWGLLIASKHHRQAVLDALNQSDLSINTAPEDLVGMISRIPTLAITFSLDDLPSGGPVHNKPLYVIVECLGNTMPACLVKTGPLLTYARSEQLSAWVWMNQHSYHLSKG